MSRPPAVAMTSAGKGVIDRPAPASRRQATSTAPQARSTATSHGPSVAAATPPSSAYTTNRRRTGGDVRLHAGRSSERPAWTATAATAAPAPAPAPRIQSGGEPRKIAARPTIRTSPGRTNAAPPTSAPAAPRVFQAVKIASCVDAGPGRRLTAARPSSNCPADIHRRRSTTSSRRSAMCAGGPPKPTTPIRPHARAIAPSVGTTRASRRGGWRPARS